MDLKHEHNHRFALTQTLAALLALAAAIWTLLSLRAYSLAERGEVLAGYSAAAAWRAEHVTTSTRQNEPMATAQNVAALPTVALDAPLSVSASKVASGNAKRAVGAYRGIYEGDAITGELTHYCSGSCCNGKWAGITADGTVLDENTPPVVGCNWLPFDAVVEVNGIQYRAADRGGEELSTVGRLDIYVPEGHQAALDMGRQCGVEITIVSLPGGEHNA
jgi:hypothetical protein